VEAVKRVAAFVLEKLRISGTVVHPCAYAGIATAMGLDVVDGPFTPKPLISTGAGDHFQAGFCIGKLRVLCPNWTQPESYGTGRVLADALNMEAQQFRDLLVLLILGLIGSTALHEPRFHPKHIPNELKLYHELRAYYGASLNPDYVALVLWGFTAALMLILVFGWLWV